MGPQGRVPQFKVECGWSHTATDDPIVHHGHPGRPHLHDFFGNTATDARSTPESLVGGDPTCQTQLDPAAYWAPALQRDGAVLQPTGSVDYYRPAVGRDPTQRVLLPHVLVPVAGAPTTHLTPQRLIQPRL